MYEYQVDMKTGLVVVPEEPAKAEEAPRGCVATWLESHKSWAFKTPYGTYFGRDDIPLVDSALDAAHMAEKAGNARAAHDIIEWAAQLPSASRR